ncbi:CBS domain-containing protein [Raoultibacter phocaeensis]|uniref:CBS domain-containing protein n=1 Tax=Raoultibacter phocaeensis TaxID=2479841 RepID=UPI00111958F0|nr:CBS domain-containing protein [Raoultibacter phocaeensis]
MRIKAEPFAEGSADEPERTSPQPILSLIGKADAYRIGSTATVLEALETIVKTQTGGVPVVDDRGHVVGFVTDGDIMRYLTGGERKAMDPLYAYMAIAEQGDLAKRVPALLATNVMELATKKVVCIEADAPVEDVCLTLSNPRIKKVPVVSNGKLSGTVSRSDLVRYFLKEFALLPKPAAPGSQNQTPCALEPHVTDEAACSAPSAQASASAQAQGRSATQGAPCAAHCAPSAQTASSTQSDSA